MSSLCAWRLSERALPLALWAALGGCADAEGRFKRFEERAAQVAHEPGIGAAGADAGGASDACQPPAPGVVGGPALLALETSARPGVAILFFGSLETPVLDGTTGVRFEYRALDALDRRTLVGEELVVGPYPIADDGRFDAKTDESTLPGRANAILPGVPITSELTLHGTICGVSDFYCGIVSGTVSAPIAGPTTGNFGLTLLDTLDDLPAQPRFGCADDALAPALE